MLELKNIEKKVGAFSINNVHLKVTSGGYFVILGPSGAGKTMLLEIIAGILKPDAGSIHVHGVDITKLNASKRNIGIVFQENALFPHLNVEKNISYALLHKRHSKVDIRARVFKWAEITNIVHLLDRMPDRLSGGEARRVALARTLAMQPGLLLLDEPLSSLDALLQFEMMKLLKEINNAGLTVIHVTHEPAEAWALAGFLAIMNNGRIEQTGTPTQVFGRPESRFVAALAGTRNFFPVLQSVTENTLTKITTTNGMLLISTELLHTGQSCFINEFDIQIGLTDETAGKNIFTGTIMERIPAQNYATLVIDTGLVFCVRVSSNDDKDCMLQPGSTVSLKIPESAIKASGNHATIS